MVQASRRISVVQTPVVPVVGELIRRQEISEDAARQHPHRHVLTRALGVRESAVPDLAEMTPQPGDIFLMCSDGLTAHLVDSEIKSLLLEQCEPQLACKALVNCANQRGGIDNTTVLVVHYEK